MTDTPNKVSTSHRFCTLQQCGKYTPLLVPKSHVRVIERCLVFLARVDIFGECQVSIMSIVWYRPSLKGNCIQFAGPGSNP